MQYAQAFHAIQSDKAAPQLPEAFLQNRFKAGESCLRFLIILPDNGDRKVSLLLNALLPLHDLPLHDLVVAVSLRIIAVTLFLE